MNLPKSAVEGARRQSANGGRTDNDERAAARYLKDYEDATGSRRRGRSSADGLPDFSRLLD
jgi:hypothetical protein